MGFGSDDCRSGTNTADQNDDKVRLLLYSDDSIFHTGNEPPYYFYKVYFRADAINDLHRPQPTLKRTRQESHLISMGMHTLT